MTRIAFVNMVGYQRGKGRISYTEPVHLLGMHGKCKEGGHHSGVFQYRPEEGDSIREIKGFNPGVVGLSFIGSPKKFIAGAHELLRLLRIGHLRNGK